MSVVKRAFIVLVAWLVVASLGAPAEAKLGGGQSFRGGSGGTRSSSSRSSSSSSRGSSSSSGRSSYSGGYSSGRSSSYSGNSYSSGSSGSSYHYSGSGGGGDIQLSPQCCALLVLAIIVVLLVLYFMNNSSAPPPPRYVRPREPESVQTGGREDWLRALLRHDPNFSIPAFLDFSVLLYMRAQEKLEAVRPYVRPDALSKIPRAGGAMETVCVGGARFLEPEVRKEQVTLPVRFEASLTLADGRTICSHETWWFVRPTTVTSPAPEKLTALGCPSCGNPAECRPDGRCKSCDNVVTNGRYGWSVARVSVEKRWTQSANEVASGGGSDEPPPPTAIDRELAPARRAFLMRYRGFSFDAFEQDVERTFHALQQAWTERAFEKARPYESDALFQTHRFWMESYRRHRRTNVLEQVRVKKLQTVKVARDAFYDAITVRIWMSMIDYTRDDATGQVLSGDTRSPHVSTEYWTFIRRAGCDAPRSQNDPGKNCPACGAPVQVNMAGVCEHCDAKVTSGEFGWVLSRIDQDSVYEG